MRPMFSYIGSKWNLAKRYGAPRYPVTVEPFAGSACYSLYWDVRRAILVDVDEFICGVWDYLIRATENEVRSLPLDFDHIDDLKIAEEAKYLIGFWIKKGGADPGKSRTQWAKQYRYATDAKVWNEAARERVAKQLSGVREWRIIKGDFSVSPDTEAQWFCDPPYQISGPRCYRHYDIDFEDAASWCRNRKGHVIVCENSEADWLPFKPLHNARGTFGSYRSGVSKEAVWMS